MPTQKDIRVQTISIEIYHTLLPVGGVYFGNQTGNSLQHLPQLTSQKSNGCNIGVCPVYQYVCVSGVKYDKNEVLGQPCALLPLLPDRECCIVLYCLVLDVPKIRNNPKRSAALSLLLFFISRSLSLSHGPAFFLFRKSQKIVE